MIDALSLVLIKNEFEILDFAGFYKIRRTIWIRWEIKTRWTGKLKEKDFDSKSSRLSSILKVQCCGNSTKTRKLATLVSKSRTHLKHSGSPNAPKQTRQKQTLSFSRFSTC